MLKNLFGSGARVRILEHFVLNPTERYYQRQLAQLLGLVVRSVQQEMPRLVRAGVLRREVDGNRVYHRVDRGCPILPELTRMFIKTSRIAELLRKGFSVGKGSIVTAFIYGSYARGEEQAWSDIDLFVVGDTSGRTLAEITSKAAEDLGRPVNERLFTPAELAKRVSGGDHFVTSVLKEPKIFLVGDASTLQSCAGASGGNGGASA